MYCLNVLDHFVGLTLKRLTSETKLHFHLRPLPKFLTISSPNMMEVKYESSKNLSTCFHGWRYAAMKTSVEWRLMHPNVWSVLDDHYYWGPFGFTFSWITRTEFWCFLNRTDRLFNSNWNKQSVKFVIFYLLILSSMILRDGQT